MIPERWQQIKAILVDALECDSQPERAALVDCSCAGDTFLKDEVESLLSHADACGLAVRGKNNATGIAVVELLTLK